MKQSYVSFLLIFLLGCNSEEYNSAISTYQSAKANDQLKPVVLALENLSKLKPQQYKPEYLTALQAYLTLEQSIKYLSENKVYLAYISSHNSYRKYPHKENRRALINTGEKLFPLVKIQKNVMLSYQYDDEYLSQVAFSYTDSSIDEWNLVELNEILEQLKQNSHSLKRSLSRLKEINVEQNIPELKYWQQNISNKYKSVNQIFNYLVSLTRFRCAQKLLDLNKYLASQSEELFALFGSANRAEKLMSVYFMNAKEQYMPYQTLIENVALSTKLKRKNIYADWYNEWKILSFDTFNPEDKFKYYPELAKSRIMKISQLLQDNTLQNIKPIVSSVDNKNKFIIDSLIKTLNKDKALLI